jgi:glycosyltransferase involved in cell wall biosynthesis
LLIVVPTLNSHDLLSRLLSTLQEQTWPHWRLLFIDGPSDDEHQSWLTKCCAADSRCRWLRQDPACPGIFEAMNQGFAEASSDDWVLFWGSDDWAAGPDVLSHLVSAVEYSLKHNITADLIVCRGRYADANSGVLARPTVFQPAGLLNTIAYRRALWFGSTPPHQATLFGPRARRYLSRYAPGFRLSADLDYFLQLSRHSGLFVQCLDLELVHMSAAGISGQQTWRRLHEVRRAYCRAFAWRWWFPFIARYIRRFLSLIKSV